MIELRPEGRFRNNWLMDGWMIRMEEKCSRKRKQNEQSHLCSVFTFYFMFISCSIFAFFMSSSSVIFTS